MKDIFDIWDEFDKKIENFNEKREKCLDRAERIGDAVDVASDILPDIGYMALDAVGELISNLFDN